MALTNHLSAIELPQLVNAWFQVLFHSPSRGTFQYSLTLLFATGCQGILSLRGWSPQIHTRFHGTGATRDIPGGASSFAYWTITIYGGAFQTPSARQSFCNLLLVLQNKLGIPTTPIRQRLQAWHRTGLGWFRFARRYSGSRGFFLLLRVLRCFSSPRSLLIPMNSESGHASSTQRVSPFGNPRVIACWAAHRGLSQPCNVLHRFLAPDHPPCTLRSLTTISRLHNPPRILRHG